MKKVKKSLHPRVSLNGFEELARILLIIEERLEEVDRKLDYLYRKHPPTPPTKTPIDYRDESGNPVAKHNE